MISLPKLDDQNYAEIVEAAKRRIPVIFPEWTDFNEHDPGITVIELFAWLKEMQQYTLDRIPDSTREAMLRLAGVQPLEAAPAAVELIPAAPPEFLPAGSTAHSADGTEFTLTEPFRRQDAQISKIYMKSPGGYVDAGRQTGVVPDAAFIHPGHLEKVTNKYETAERRFSGFFYALKRECPLH